MAANYYFDEEAFWQYKDELDNSEGFHVLSDYGSQLMGGILHVSQDNVELELLQVLNVNMGPSTSSVYYITLEAWLPWYKVKHCHTKVWSKISNGFQLQIFRVAPYAAKRFRYHRQQLLLSSD